MLGSCNENKTIKKGGAGDDRGNPHCQFIYVNAGLLQKTDFSCRIKIWGRKAFLVKGTGNMKKKQ